MAQASPFSLIDQLFDRVTSTFQPPAWLVSELQHRGVLLINHVLMQEPEAMARLARQKGRVASVQWRLFDIKLIITPAGLIDLAEPGANSDLHLAVTESSPTSLVQAVVAGEKPPVRIQGDVQFAAEINSIVDLVLWDLAKNLARSVCDGPAPTAVAAVKNPSPVLNDSLTRFPAPSIVRDKAGL